MKSKKFKFLKMVQDVLLMQIFNTSYYLLFPMQNCPKFEVEFRMETALTLQAPRLQYRSQTILWVKPFCGHFVAKSNQWEQNESPIFIIGTGV